MPWSLCCPYIAPYPIAARPGRVGPEVSVRRGGRSRACIAMDTSHAMSWSVSDVSGRSRAGEPSCDARYTAMGLSRAAERSAEWINRRSPPRGDHHGRARSMMVNTSIVHDERGFVKPLVMITDQGHGWRVMPAMPRPNPALLLRAEWPKPSVSKHGSGQHERRIPEEERQTPWPLVPRPSIAEIAAWAAAQKPRRRGAR